MPRRRRLNDDAGESSKRARRPAQATKHLYLVLDDCVQSYSIHRLDADDDTGSIHKPDDDPATRFVAPGSQMHFVGMAGNIVGQRPSVAVVVLAASLLVAAPPPFGEEEAVTAYAVHPDARTIFVSTTGGGTYSFDTERRKWRRHGEWVLPFRGQGYFDGELDAWVGLHREDQGRVCACHVASRGGARPPEYSETLDYREASSSSCKKNRRQRATLTYMGDSMFCAVETYELVGTSPSSSSKEGGGGVEVHVTMFGLKYNRRGELQTRVRRATGAFLVPKHVSSYSPVAFWM
ncbi:hypothetical protein E2562_008036 [Oryza meyeriana var. granulata]|uniref:Uncharacterized protein n=1 Tax=Oryza meyeriana var. granulata TaxID=110450 RepID=A0A6G1DFQ9_9ORYZ|nr:hypothetical protein E2562_008036 [Oryza meyeriana var. granulata]